ncbi:uncharacterized protein MONBRDRAFT_39279 [Monosiga brevicollis MX1]|uniref:Nucleoside phosphorylase domain-containing protein n=1 Tax=Monosiga brevicollis TaxID=81824 RepID=A9VDG3_MONBE|nr:uncharacterized protein MONBRDRAFT_39279 [Monosiga brevicollis MX1]EDQ84441.1 predicted protein [Monosiga brevicollis MX1]|eukprot:XP_001750736.1 hypothetical protein [Monosiga brevicollis MX1]
MAQHMEHHEVETNYAPVMYPDVLIICAKVEERNDAFAAIRDLQRERPDANVEVIGDLNANRVSLGGNELVYGDLHVANGQVHAPFLDAERVTRTSSQPRVGAIGLRWVLAAGPRQGPESGAAGVATLLARLRPRAAVMLGMCAGRQRKFCLGDVVCAGAATHILEGKREGQGLVMLDRRRMEDSRAMNIARIVEQKSPKFRQHLCPRPPGLARRVMCAEFASGPMVEENGSMWKDALGRRCDAYDMEASALFTATEQYQQVFDRQFWNLGVVKGIMDFGTAASRGGEAQPTCPNGTKDSALIEYLLALHFDHASASTDEAAARFVPDKDQIATLAVRNATVAVFLGVLPAYCQQASLSAKHISLGCQFSAAKQAEKDASNLHKAYKDALMQTTAEVEAESSDGHPLLMGPVQVTQTYDAVGKQKFTLEVALTTIHGLDLPEDVAMTVRTALQNASDQQVPQSRNFAVKVMASSNVPVVMRAFSTSSTAEPVNELAATTSAEEPHPKRALLMKQELTSV